MPARRTTTIKCIASVLGVGHNVFAHEGDANYMIVNIYVGQLLDESGKRQPIAPVGYVYTTKNGKVFLGSPSADRFTFPEYALLSIGTRLSPRQSLPIVMRESIVTGAKYTVTPCFTKQWNVLYPKGA